MKKILLLLIIIPLLSRGQNNNAPSSYDPHDIKITGYLQTQFQKVQSPGVTSFSGGDFSTNADHRFMIRRGRLKIDRVDKYTSVVFQLDATQDGVQLMDAFIQLRHPKYKSVNLTAGLFNRPFGYSIVYSSGYRDFPERPRVFQTIMPRERDIGAMVGFHPVNGLKFLNAEFAVVNGSGQSAKDYDSKADYIGNLFFKFDSLAAKKLYLAFGGSVYKGSVRNNTKTYYTATDLGYNAHTGDEFIGKNIDRSYYGANLQVQYDNDFGSTSLKTEYVTGNQPGVASSADIKGPYASRSFTSQPATDLYRRPFNGYYVWFTQVLGKTGLTALLAYDVYDPNTKASGQTIGALDNFTNDGDVKFNTLGYGLTYQVSQRLKLTVYNEQVKNEKTSLKNYLADIKDNVFTTRLQYRW
ncbi:porin [Sphingobacterium sp. SRCM116780]|uniref:porin n=1 Tax=Sphingobacterium sp. SRCM116780 TaxID=2907623 RepID=UPI001F47CED6|nr:porin [Sphingobacterium sp. SRCM116780]UIR54888.1 porin [Sphingobacterium sp. SRCM116780]